MKALKTIFALFCLFGLSFLFACSNEDIDYEEIYNSIEVTHKYVRNNTSHRLANSIELLSEHEGCTIAWVSSNESIVDNTGKIVNRPSESTNVPFTYTITKDGISKTYDFSFDVASMSLEDANNVLKALDNKEVEESLTLPTNFANSVINVTYTSSDLSVIGECGCYTQPAVSKDIVLNYTLSDGHNSISDSVTIKAIGKTVDERIEETIEWLQTGGFADLYLTSETTFPTEYEKAGTEIEWTCSAKDVFVNGKITQYVYERYVTMFARINTKSKYEDIKFYCSVKPLDTSKMTKAEIVENFISSIAVSSYNKLNFNQDEGTKNDVLAPYEYDDITKSYGFISFYKGSDLTIIENIAPLDSESGHDNRPGTIKPSIAYITVHDTAGTSSSSTALANSNYVKQGGGGTSWHYTVDDCSIYHQIPDEEIAYHAGDSGSRYFALIDTGVKATSIKPVVTFKEGYFYINGIKTEVSPFLREGSAEYRYNIDCELNEQGVICEIGENGNYYLGKTYYNTTYKYIANYGGNAGSIGIESCVNYSHDYAKTVRNLAKLVAKLCIDNNLSVDRVKGHHYFSGKPCPNAILLAEWWSNFLDLVSLEKFAKESLGAYTFEYTPVTSNINEDGFIDIKAKANQEVQYTIVVKEGSTEILNKTYTTILK